MIKRYNKFSAAVICLLSFFSAQAVLSQQPDSSTQVTSSFAEKWYHIYPISDWSIRTYTLSDGHPNPFYQLFNSDGDFINKGFNTFTQINGRAEAFNCLSFRYRLQLQNLERVYWQRFNFAYRDSSISILVGLDSMWLGHGYHGSLLLSNNAPPFTMVKFQTEKPFRIPYVGKFNYLIFNGWAENFKILSQRISYFPASWFEFGINQTIVYKKNYKLWEFFKVLSASQENLPGHFNNDQRASMDVALYMPFLKDFTPIENGKIYFEYAGEDIYAWWQPEDGKWIGPIGLEFFDTGITTGLSLETKNSILHVEYSQNYSNKNIFHNVHAGSNYALYTKKWYRTIPFVNYGSIMGHHMGPEADDIYFELQHRFKNIGIKVFYDKERHGLVSGYGTVYSVNKYPEKFIQFGCEFNYRWNNVNTSLSIVKNNYQNIDRDPDVLEIISQRGTQAQSLIIGLTLSYQIAK
jgi:hypothetical protein